MTNHFLLYTEWTEVLSKEELFCEFRAHFTACITKCVKEEERKEERVEGKRRRGGRKKGD
jgi:hypothetical protein